MKKQGQPNLFSSLKTPVKSYQAVKLGQAMVPTKPEPVAAGKPAPMPDALQPPKAKIK